MAFRKIRVICCVLGVAACSAPEPGEMPTAEASQALEAPTVRFGFVKTADFGTGYNARVDVTNISTSPIVGWSVAFDMPRNVAVNISSLPACVPGAGDNCWFIFSDVGIENIVRINQTSSDNVLNPGQTRSYFLFGTYEGAFGLPTQCFAPQTTTRITCDGSADLTPPSPASNLRIFGTGSTLVDLFWSPATDDVGVTGYIVKYAQRTAPALEIGEVPATAPVTRARITRLVSQTDYTFLVQARDAAGNVSELVSSPITTTATPGIATTFATSNTWPGGGFQGEFRVTNNESVPLDDWRVTFSFTGSFQSVWDGVLSGGPGTFTISAPAHNRRLDPGETAIVGATGAFGNPATPPSGFVPAAGSFAVRALATPQAPCLGLQCPSGTQCSVLPNGIPTCI
jgi:hypothetical protein